jgi:hypothetical protein
MPTHFSLACTTRDSRVPFEPWLALAVEPHKRCLYIAAAATQCMLDTAAWRALATVLIAAHEDGIIPDVAQAAAA